MRLPGFSKSQPAVAALPPVPKPEDPEIETARKRLREQEKLRSGRRGSVLTGGQGVTEKRGAVSRPEGRAAELLGG